MTEEEALVNKAIRKNGAEETENYLVNLFVGPDNADEYKAMVARYGKENADIYWTAANEVGREKLDEFLQSIADSEAAANAIKQILVTVQSSIASTFFDTVGGYLKDAIIVGAIDGMEGANRYIENQDDSEKALMKALGMAAIDALVTGVVQGIMIASGLQATFEAAGEAMGNYIKGGLNVVKIQMAKEDEVRRHEAVNAEIGAAYARLAAISYVRHQEINQEKAKRNFIIGTYKIEVDAMYAAGKLSEKDWMLTQNALDRQYARSNREAKDAHTAERDYFKKQKTWIWGAAVEEKVRHDEKMLALDKFEKAAQATSDKGKAAFATIMEGIPDDIRNVVDMLQDMGLTDFIAEIMEALGITPEDYGFTPEPTPEPTPEANPIEEAIVDPVVEAVAEIEQAASTLFDGVGKTFTNILKNAIIQGAIEGMEGANGYITNQEDTEKAMMKAFGLAAIDALVTGVVSGMLIASGLQATFEAAGEAMGNHIKGGLNAVKIQQKQEDEVRRHEAVNAEIASIHKVLAAKSAANHEEINQESLIRTFIIQSYKLEVNAMYAAGKITQEQWKTAQDQLDLQQTDSNQKAKDAHKAEEESFKAQQTWIWNSAASEKKRHDAKMSLLQDWENMAKDTSAKGKAAFDKIMGGLPDQIRNVIELLQSMGLSDYIAEIMEAFGLTAEDFNGAVNGPGGIKDTTEDAIEAIEKTLDLRDYVSFVGGAALGELGRAGAVFESGQEYVEGKDPIADRSLYDNASFAGGDTNYDSAYQIGENDEKSNSSYQRAFSDGPALNNEVTVEIDGDTLVKANISSRAYSDLANVPGA